MTHRPMTLSTKRWKELKNGYGLEEVPRGLRMICCMCTRSWPGKLYTNQPIGHWTTQREYQREIDQIRDNCYCRHHAEQMFAEDTNE